MHACFVRLHSECEQMTLNTLKTFGKHTFTLCLNIHRISENPMTIIFYRHTSRKPYPHEHTHRETTVGFYSPCMREGNAAGGKKAVSLAQSRSNNC